MDQKIPLDAGLSDELLTGILPLVKKGVKSEMSIICETLMQKYNIPGQRFHLI
jgi:hypothetical protein